LVGQSLSANQTLISQNGIFELGFFKPAASLSIYLGIWYKNFANKTIVWVANRESPSNNPASSKLELLSDGNLVLLKNFTETVNNYVAVFCAGEGMHNQEQQNY
jgi:hypothetical protein